MDEDRRYTVQMTKLTHPVDGYTVKSLRDALKYLPGDWPVTVMDTMDANFCETVWEVVIRNVDAEFRVVEAVDIPPNHDPLSLTPAVILHF